ncbi:hypothetical protein EWM64_g5537 [Hericium alpestre]|uniref:Uncharacterized protein n=1 Tax=Hericium alpestre TaxID=135208 RepID=A0A4Y9ZWN7_9AGAM|nr:hypothetical protein EWM64_g5537 [Hericium alpestre]
MYEPKYSCEYGTHILTAMSSQPYTREDWIVDIQLASTHGFDGFALNVGREDWQRARVADCYAAAQQLQTRFKLFLSFDMSAQPNSQAWVDGFPHDPWLVLNAYFIRAFKEGRMPPVEKDRIFMWARPHPKAAEATEDDVGRPTGWELTDDVFWVVVFATAPAIVILDTGAQTPSTPGRHDIGAGVTKLAHKLVAGGGMRGQTIRGGTVVAECAPSPEEYKFEARPRTYNFNAYVAMSP